MTRKNDGGPAFPQPIAVGPAGDVYFPHDYGLDGMSVRQVYKAIIASGWLASGKQWEVDDIATYCSQIADALIAEDEKDA